MGGVEIAEVYIPGDSIPVKPEIAGVHETGNFKGRVGEWRLLAKRRKKCKILQ